MLLFGTQVDAVVILLKKLRKRNTQAIAEHRKRRNCRLRLAGVEILDCIPVKKSNKLLQFTINDGTNNNRIILSGIHKYYEPAELIGKKVVAILNLPPRSMMGIDSCGMLISAVHNESGEEKLNLLIVDDKIPAGAKLY